MKKNEADRHPGIGDELAAAMMAGAVADPPWQEFVGRLRERFKGSHANIIFRRADLKTAFMTQDSSEEVRAFGDLQKRHDPTLDPIPYFRMAPCRAYRIEDFAEPQAEDDHPFVANFLRPLGMARLILCRVVVPQGLQAWISVTRDEGAPFDNRELALLERVSALFAHSLAVFGRYHEAIDQRDAYARVVNSQATGVIRFDEAGTVLHCDEAGARLLAEGRFATLAGGRLAPVRKEDQSILAHALRLVTSGASEEELIAIEDGRGDRVELLLFRASELLDPAWTQPARAIGYLSGAGAMPTPSPERLRKLFGLTRREAALTIMLARGLSLADAARDLGIADQTARAYLRQIFQKCGVTRQAELVRRIQISIARIR